MSANDKLIKAISQHMGDFRLNEVALAHDIWREPYEVQARFLNTALALIHRHVRSWEHGLVRAELYDLVSACMEIYECGLGNYVEPEPEVAGGTEYISTNML